MTRVLLCVCIDIAFRVHAHTASVEASTSTEMHVNLHVGAVAESVPHRVALYCIRISLATSHLSLHPLIIERT